MDILMDMMIHITLSYFIKYIHYIIINKRNILKLFNNNQFNNH